MKPKAKKSKKGYVQKQNAVNITLYDQTGEYLDPVAQKEFEDAALEVAMRHNILLSITTT